MKMFSWPQSPLHVIGNRKDVSNSSSIDGVATNLHGANFYYATTSSSKPNICINTFVSVWTEAYSFDSGILIYTI